jgi:hypothetical protein
VPPRIFMEPLKERPRLATSFLSTGLQKSSTVMSVNSEEGSIVLRISMGMPNIAAGMIHRGCSTCVSCVCVGAWMYVCTYVAAGMIHRGCST